MTFKEPEKTKEYCETQYFVGTIDKTVSNYKKNLLYFKVYILIYPSL